MKTKPLALSISLCMAAVLQSGCANNSSKINTQESDRLSALEQELKQSQSALATERQLRAQAESQTTAAVSAGNAQAGFGQEPLLPPGAKTGECYARVWVEPSYRTLQKMVTVQEASESVQIVPAQYQWVEEQVLVQDASNKLINVPAKYETVTERILVQDKERFWVSDLKSRKPVSTELLRSAKSGGIDLDGSPINMCYHEHVIPAKTRSISKQVEIAPATFQIETAPAQYRMVEKRVLVKEASKKLVTVPAKYETYSEQIIDKPAHTTWKKGSGPIQKIDSSTGEIMCLVEVPASYKTVNRRRLVSAARTEEIEIPAEYETVKVRELVSEADQRRIEIPAKYKNVTTTETISAPEFVWHEVHDKSMDSHSRTGNKICLVETPEKYQTIQKQVVKNEAYTQTLEVPAVYETKKVKKLVSEAREIRNAIPAVTKNVSYRELDKEGFMEWRSILCETNVTPSLISRLQQKLNAEGYEAGSPDGVVGSQTIKAVNAYQADNKLPKDRYLNIKTLKHLDLL